VRNPRAFLEVVDTAERTLVPRLRAFVSEYERQRAAEGSRPLRILDVGCGPQAILASHVAAQDSYVGCDYRAEAEVPLEQYVSIDLNEESLAARFPDDRFDVIFCGEVIEHLFSPDALLDDLRALLAPGGVLILSTPNLGYYVNRALLLVGISPLFLENSAEVKLGRVTKRLGQGNVTEGHIRVFTHRALRDLVARKGFRVLRVVPVTVWGFALDRILGRIPTLAADNVMVLERFPSAEKPSGPPKVGGTVARADGTGA
jgi:SAM-dependent methyltransferase